MDWGGYFHHLLHGLPLIVLCVILIYGLIPEQPKEPKRKEENTDAETSTDPAGAG